MELVIFACFHALPGRDEDVAAAIREVVPQTRAEAGCLDIHGFRSRRDASLFYIHSRWKDEAVFDLHAELRHTLHFVAGVEPLIDHPLDVVRTSLIA
jgi:quinol monooxygenase YgiN